MAKPGQKQKTIGEWTVETLYAAVESIRNGASVYQTLKQLAIPYSTRGKGYKLAAANNELKSAKLGRSRAHKLHLLRHQQQGSISSSTDFDFSSYYDTLKEAPPHTALPPSSLPKDMTVRLHQEARLQCELSKKSESMYNSRWWHDNAIAVDGTTAHSVSHHYTLNPMSGELHITNVRIEDDGLWWCGVHDPGIGRVIKAERGFKLLVTDPPRAVYLEVDGRRLDKNKVLLPVREGAPLTVTCVVEGGLPTPELNWRLTLDNRLPQPELNVTLVEDVPQYIRSDIRLDAVERADQNASVMCLVYHVTLTEPINVTLLLDVQYTPSFAIGREPGFGFPLVEGIPVSLKCDVDSNPPSKPVWVKDDGPPPVPQSADGFLNFTAIHREHSGWYKCTSGEFSSIGYFLNVRYDVIQEVTEDPGSSEVTSTERQIEVALGGAVHLQCPATGVSCWSRVGTGGALEPVGIGPELSLEKVLYQEAGSYRCITGGSPRLEEWKSLVNIDLSVTGAPAVYPSNRTLRAYPGQELSLMVEFCANPPANRAFWLTDRLLLRPGDTVSTLIAHNIKDGSSPHCHQAVLTLRTVRPWDTGEYVFVVRSPKGLAEGSVIVNVTNLNGFAVTGGGWRLSPVSILCLAIVLGFLFWHQPHTH
ncbi:MAM domain-containing glycosylphosphatidylinositol anchor protein 1 [Anabrus simplex]|uniref:MAM domain-containing glycosylphosphatidylinositol anchor protein 1 n=1 Tax=Anabrus simplex TaxID=316456 RepID=UPI0035A37B33